MTTRSSNEKRDDSDGEKPFLVEFAYFLRHHMVWVVAPLVIVILAAIVIAVLSAIASRPQPFIYPGM